ncbi:unnamed protein product [Amoebophrya sp. A25]|nr:unnamed protein product [Amoebophrya sp. A25]|eukprot:GSA25T00016371001.1
MAQRLRLVLLSETPTERRAPKARKNRSKKGGNFFQPVAASWAEVLIFFRAPVCLFCISCVSPPPEPKATVGERLDKILLGQACERVRRAPRFQFCSVC